MVDRRQHLDERLQITTGRAQRRGNQLNIDRTVPIAEE
jgi:hypothetical protein